jgi:hypothetical protein
MKYQKYTEKSLFLLNRLIDIYNMDYMVIVLQDNYIKSLESIVGNISEKKREKILLYMLSKV